MRLLPRMLLVLLSLAWGNYQFNLMQGVAWSGMLVLYSQESGIEDAVDQTFSGEHPCHLCKAVQQARESQPEKADQSLNKSREKQPADARLTSVTVPQPVSRPVLWLPPEYDLQSFRTEPPSPPPRRV